MPELPHLDCTSEQRREEIVKNYIVHADDCIVLYDGRTVRSDANNRVIADRYYQFSCKSKIDGSEYVIFCGSGAARHLCKLIKQPLPPSFNPFIGNGGAKGKEGEIYKTSEWNPLRKKLYYAVQLFIIRYQKTIKPGTTIFKLRQSLCDPKYIGIKPRDYHIKSCMSVISKYDTTMSQIICELSAYGDVRNFVFNDLYEFAKPYVTSALPNIFI